MSYFSSKYLIIFSCFECNNLVLFISIEYVLHTLQGASVIMLLQHALSLTKKCCRHITSLKIKLLTRGFLNIYKDVMMLKTHIPIVLCCIYVICQFFAQS